MYKYKVLKPDGSSEEFTTDKLSLAGLQRLVGGFIERIVNPALWGIETGGNVYINEDGRRLKLPVNQHIKAVGSTDIVGNIVIEQEIL